MQWYALGAVLGLLALATVGQKREPLVPVPRHPTVPPQLDSLPGKAPSAPILRGISPTLTDAILNAPKSPDRTVEKEADTIVLQLDRAIAKHLARATVEAINKAAASVTLSLVATEAALSMLSGATRVIFTAYEPKSNVNIKLVASYENNILKFVRPYSAMPNNTESPVDLGPAASYACFKPPIDPSTCSNAAHGSTPSLMGI